VERAIVLVGSAYVGIMRSACTALTRRASSSAGQATRRCTWPCSHGAASLLYMRDCLRNGSLGWPARIVPTRAFAVIFTSLPSISTLEADKHITV
jgi:hypothetical protein